VTAPGSSRISAGAVARSPSSGIATFRTTRRVQVTGSPWADYGGHAVRTVSTSITSSEDPAMVTKGSTVPEVPTRLTMKPDPLMSTRSRWLYVWSDHRADPGNRQLSPIRPLLLTRFVDADSYAVAYEPPAGDANATSLEYFVRSIDVARTDVVPLAPSDLAAELQASHDEGYELAKRRGVAAVGGI
jgi:hypothetical protein